MTEEVKIAVRVPMTTMVRVGGPDSDSDSGSGHGLFPERTAPDNHWDAGQPLGQTLSGRYSLWV